MRDESYRYTLDNPTGFSCELYDLSSDPRELNNCVEDSEYGVIVEQFKEVVLKHHAHPAEILYSHMIRTIGGVTS